MQKAAPAGATITGVDIFGPQTPDGKTVIAFYRDKLGMKPTMGGGPGDDGAEFEFADGTTFGVYEPDGAKAGAGYTALFAVGDIDAAVTWMRSNGAELADPFETPVCFMSFGKDPDGNEFAIHQRKTKAS